MEINIENNLIESEIQKEIKNKKFKKILIISFLALALLIIVIVFSFYFLLRKNQTQKTLINSPIENIDDTIPAKAVEKYEDKSAEHPIGSEAWINLIALTIADAKRGEFFASAEECDSDGHRSTDGLCVGGYAAKQGDLSICETHNFKNLYLSYPSCDFKACSTTKRILNFDNGIGNSEFENCYIGYGIINKDETICENLPETQENKNVPQYDDDRTAVQQMKKESCLYGAAIGKNNYDICEIAGFFKNYCYDRFAELINSEQLCYKIDNDDQKSSCLKRFEALIDLSANLPESKVLNSFNELSTRQAKIGSEVATGYIWNSFEGSPNFSSVTLPVWGVLSDKGFLSREYSIDIWNGKDFVFYTKAYVGKDVTFPQGGVYKFRVTGISPEYAICPGDRKVGMWGFKFSSNGTFNGERIPIVVDVSSLGKSCKVVN